jgi:hypothetical protein
MALFQDLFEEKPWKTISRFVTHEPDIAQFSSRTHNARRMENY